MEDIEYAICVEFAFEAESKESRARRAEEELRVRTRRVYPFVMQEEGEA